MGFLIDSVRWLRNPQRFLEEHMKREGLTFTGKLPVIGQTLFTGDPQLISRIIRHPDLVGGRGIRALRRVLGDSSLIMLDGEAHTHRRRLLVPHFTDDSSSLFDELTLEFTERQLREEKGDGPFSAFDLSCNILLHVILRILFGRRSDGEEERMATLVRTFLSSTRSPSVLFLKPLQIDLGRMNGWGRALKSKRMLLQAIGEVIDSGLPGESLLSQILSANERDATPLNREQIMQEILSLLLFGHETTAASLSWVFAHVLADESITLRIREEAAASLQNEGTLKVESLPYAKACVEESLRINPVVMHLMRVAKKDVRLGDHLIRKGEMAAPSPFLAHRNPDLFPEPDRFLPDRFLNPQSLSSSCFPFGLGSRVCLGQHLALRQMTLILSTASLRSDLRLAPSFRLDPVRNMVLVIPRGGTPLVKGA